MAWLIPMFPSAQVSCAQHSAQYAFTAGRIVASTRESVAVVCRCAQPTQLYGSPSLAQSAATTGVLEC